MRGITWRLIHDPELDPPLNMAIDEALLMWCSRLNTATLRFYRWKGCAVSIGYFQHAQQIEQSMNLPVEYTLVRRPTGGGVVVHAEDITFSLCFPEKLLTGTVVDSYRKINRCIIRQIARSEAFSLLAQDTPPIHKQKETRFCFTNPTRYDILWNNIKVGGSAQRRKSGVVLHQSSFFYKQCAEAMEMTFDDGGRAFFTDAIRKAVATLFSADFIETELSDDESHTAQNLYAEKYSLSSWNYSR